MGEMFESVEHIPDHVPDVFTLLTHLSAIIAANCVCKQYTILFFAGLSRVSLFIGVKQSGQGRRGPLIPRVLSDPANRI